MKKERKKREKKRALSAMQNGDSAQLWPLFIEESVESAFDGIDGTVS